MKLMKIKTINHPIFNHLKPKNHKLSKNSDQEQQQQQKKTN